MRLLFTFALILLATATPLAAGITNNGDGTSTLWYCSTDAAVSKLDEALQTYSEAEGATSLHGVAALVVRDQSEITVGDGVADTGYCGVLAVGRSEWRVTVSNAAASSYRTAVTSAMGWTDVNPVDGLDDATGLSRNDMLDAEIRARLKAFVQRRLNLDNPPAPAADDFSGVPE